jgi:hypothetical protein
MAMGAYTGSAISELMRSHYLFFLVQAMLKFLVVTFAPYVKQEPLH